MRSWGPTIGRGARGGLVEVKIQNQAAGAWFWPTKRGGVYFRAEGTLFGWSTPHLRSWGPAIGHGMRGGWLEPKSQKLSRRGSVLADEMWWTSDLGRGDLGGSRKTKLREGRGGSLAGMQAGIWIDSPVSFPVPSLFSHPLLLPTPSNPPFPLPKTLWWVVYRWDVVVGGGGREKIGGSTPKSSAITSRT